ncbi:GmrSD restriction endonuclease domain-containing protein [Kistimonas asteriae]|uniref:GmrSD restriction endonuclease domain-containing protein n=1 Tax=Kistimonas asteriae TaxID=517724 RepID=UPI001BAD8696|nr:DUF262 domain-containing protein [Kistimonas asteriae]
MSFTKTTAQNYSEIVEKAKTGDFKLPAFQRKWKWSNKQVMSLYDSLRLGFPIGSFLFLTSNDGSKLGPRSFYGAGNKAAHKEECESLILDGQQRITAGLSILYGLDDAEGSEYYIDIKKVDALLKERKVNIEDEIAVKEFCDELEIDDGYLTAKKRRKDRLEHFHKSKLLWTPLLTGQFENTLDELTDDIADKRDKNIIRKVVKKHLRPKSNLQVPVIEPGNEFDLSSISKVFTTINTSGKLLTPFELVVAILYPHDVKLEDDIIEFKSKYGFYNNIDKNGELLLQVVALLAGRSPKKSDLPKNIDHTAYEMYGEKAAQQLDAVGEFLTSSLGLGLDVTDKLVPYDAIFAPMALAFDFISQNITDQVEIASAKSKLRTWFVASSIMQRYQEGVHNKQSRDLEDIKKWILGGDREKPKWIKDAYISKQIKAASPNGAIGKLFHCLINSKKPEDPLQREPIGFGDGLHSTQIHHVFPTRWAPKGLKGYTKSDTEINLALNTMFLFSKTNGHWLNFPPNNQLKNSVNSVGSQSAAYKIYKTQLFNDKSLEIISKNEMSVDDYDNFIEERYCEFVQIVSEYGVQEVKSKDSDLVEFESPSVVE